MCPPSSADSSDLAQGSRTYVRCRRVLLRYLSRTSVDNILLRACLAVHIDPWDLQHDELPCLIQELSPKMRLFCQATELTSLMLDLADLIMDE